MYTVKAHTERHNWTELTWLSFWRTDEWVAPSSNASQLAPSNGIGDYATMRPAHPLVNSSKTKPCPFSSVMSLCTRLKTKQQCWADGIDWLSNDAHGCSSFLRRCLLGKSSATSCNVFLQFLVALYQRIAQLHQLHVTNVNRFLEQQTMVSN